MPFLLLLLSLIVCTSLFAAEDYTEASARLEQAIKNPEFMLDHWIQLPTSPEVHSKTPRHLSLKEAILLALRYNPNIQSAELDRIVQRYQLRIAYNEFELQYALAGVGSYYHSQFTNLGGTDNKTFIASPELKLKNKLGTQSALRIENNASIYNNYNPMLNLSVTQPLLRGFGRVANESSLLNAIDNETLNKINLKQAVIDQVTHVITAYRGLVLSANNLENQKRQLDEAQKTYQINEKKITAGQLEPTGNIQQSYQIESLNLLVEQAENEFKTSAQDLLQTIGLDPHMRLAVPNNINLDRINMPNLQESIDIALNHNAAYIGMQMNLRADERAYEVAKNEQLWQLDLSVNAQSGAVIAPEGANGLKGVYSGQNTSESAQLTLTIPINDVNRRSQLITAKIKLEKDRLQLLAYRRALETTITNAITTIHSQYKRYQLAEKQVKLAEKSYDLEKKKQQAGISSSLDVNNTQNQLIQAQSGLIGAKIAYLNELSALQALLGITLDEWQIKLRYGQ